MICVKVAGWCYIRVSDLVVGVVRVAGSWGGLRTRGVCWCLECR